MFIPKAVKIYNPMKIKMAISSSEGTIDIKVSINILKSFKFLTNLATRMILNNLMTVSAEFKLTSDGMIVANHGVEMIMPMSVPTTTKKSNTFHESEI